MRKREVLPGVRTRRSVESKFLYRTARRAGPRSMRRARAANCKVNKVSSAAPNRATVRAPNNASGTR